MNIKKIACALSFCLIFSTAAFGAKKTLRIVGEEFAPMEFRLFGKVVGMDVDIAKTIFNKMKIRTKIEIHPWKRAWKMIEEGKADAVFTTSRKAEREPYLYYPKEDMWVSEFVFFTRNDKAAVFKGYASAKGKKSALFPGIPTKTVFGNKNSKPRKPKISN